MNEFKSVVSAQWLANLMEQEQLIIVDCRFSLTATQLGYEQYLEGHIPGAFYLDLDQDLSSPRQKYGGRHPLPNIEKLAAKLGEIGITSAQTWVVAYDDSRFAFASRLWWLLRYLGHNKVSLLDGGWKGWSQAGYPVTQVLPTPKPGKFIAQPQPDLLLDIETLKAKKDLPSVALIDCREGDRYRGEREPIDPVAGHIPGASNSCWQLVSDELGYFRPHDEQQKLWQPYQNADELILYCGSGVTACVNLVSLDVIGYKNTKLYLGGWSDWCSYLEES